MIFKSNWAYNKRSDKELFEFIGYMNNIPAVLPEQVVDITADYDNLAFTIQGMGKVALRVSKREPNKFIQLVPEGKVPFQFSLNIYIENNDTDSASKCHFEIDAQLNPLMQMMASRPLQNLVNMMAEKAETV